MLIIGYLIIILFLVFKWKPRKAYYKVLAILGVIVAIAGVIVSDVFQSTINTILSNEDTLAIRSIGREWYLNSLIKHPILGCGYPHEDCRAACEAAGFTRGIYIVDNGVFGFAYIYGLIGVLWIVGFWIYFLKRAKTIASRNNNYFYIMYMGLNVVICVTLAYFTSYGLCMFIWAVLTAMCEEEYRRVGKKIIGSTKEA